MVKPLASEQVEAIYTDGACSGNPGPGGWGTVIYFEGDRRHELGGDAANTTNNRMEIQAAIAALDLLTTLEQKEPPTLYTDSQYVQNGITKWIHGWKKKGWKTASGKAVLNQDLWETLDSLHQRVNSQLSAPLRWAYVRGHSGNAGNERCDAIARAFATGQRPKLIQASELSTTIPPSEQVTPPSTDNSPTSSMPQPSKQLLDNLVPSQTQPLSTVESVLTKLRAADEVAQKGYLITSTELTLITDLPQTATDSIESTWVWR
ncbi:MAG: ribonuclease HI, partial [Elainellaceae cyanobacterium]